MSTTVEPTPEQLTQQAAEHVAQSLASGRRARDIINDFTAQGWSSAQAGEFVGHIELLFRAARADAYKRKMRNGMFWALGGTIVTIWTYSAAASGGTYIVAWGAILFGAFDIIRGFIGWSKYRS